MKLDLTEVYYALSFSLDAVEKELVGVTTHHAKRVAYLSMLLGKQFGMAGAELSDLVGCALLHDNALTEFIREEYQQGKSGGEKLPFSRHCVIGEENIQLLPFRTDVTDVILYHHENADGTGPFGKKAEETNKKAQIIHLADTIDMEWDLPALKEQEYAEMCRKLLEDKDRRFAADCVEAFLAALDFQKLREMQTEGIIYCLKKELPEEYDEYTDEEIHNIAELFARIVDYKSSFTKDHSLGVAHKAEIMAKVYQYPPEKAVRYYFAAALHDIGKLIIDNQILEKIGKLTEEEFGEMKNHAAATYEILRQIKGLEDVTAWASRHHEKLDGCGYPFGMTASELSKEDRLMGCIDIYQALTEKRPYKDGLSHDKTIAMMRDMAENGKIDREIVEDLNRTLSNCL